MMCQWDTAHYLTKYQVNFFWEIMTFFSFSYSLYFSIFVCIYLICSCMHFSQLYNFASCHFCSEILFFFSYSSINNKNCQQTSLALLPTKKMKMRRSKEEAICSSPAKYELNMWSYHFLVTTKRKKKKGKKRESETREKKIHKNCSFQSLFSEAQEGSVS